MKAEIVSVGTELLMGETVDTNASYLAGRLPSLGIELNWVSQVGDNKPRVVEVLTRAWQRSDLILTTGGLGPTEDDLTREAIADSLGEKMQTDPALEKEIRGFFARRGMPMPASNIRQAALIPSAQPIHNIRGTAPGWWVERDGRILIALPGPPREMQYLWEKEVVPRLQKHATGVTILSRTIKTFGLAEAAVGEMVSALFASANPSLGVYAKNDGIQLRLTAKASSKEEAEKIIADGEASIRAVLSEYIWGTDNDTLEIAIGRLLTSKGLSLAVMESYTGGLLAATITDALEGSEYFKGGLVAYSDKAMIACGVDAGTMAQYGASSPEVTQAMATAVRQRLGADIGVGVNGLIEESQARSVGIVYASIDDGKNRTIFQGNYPANRLQLKRRATTAALIELRKTLIGGN